jgi:DNA gyrase/topoisomerase IV subunit A
MYANERLFKIGSTTRLSARIGGYNTGRPKEDSYYYCWVVKCYNSKDLDYYIQKLLVDFKHRENAELYCGIKFSDLRDIVAFIVANYDASVDYINNFIKTRLQQSLDEEDTEPPRLDCKSLTYQIGEHMETIDLEEEDENVVRDELENILSQARNAALARRQDLSRTSPEKVVIIERQELVGKISQTTNSPKKSIWYHVKDITGWKSSKTEIDEGTFTYKIKY